MTSSSTPRVRSSEDGEFDVHWELEAGEYALLSGIPRYLMPAVPFLGLGLVPAGVLADRFGRRPVLWGGLAIYLVGAAGAALAPTLEAMLVARLIWGFGAAGPRIAATAMIRT